MWKPCEDFTVRFGDKTCKNRTQSQLDKMVDEINKIANDYGFDISSCSLGAKIVNTYKYLGMVAAECFLKDQTVRFSQPKAFNDPFELQPEFWIKEDVLTDDEKVTCSFVLDGNESYYEKYLIIDPSPNTQVKKLDSQKLVGELNNQIGIFCVTRASTLIPMNVLMWSHYSESHRGAVIEFDDDCEFLKKAKEVHYVPRRPILDARMLIENERITITDLYFKSNEWCYENEARITKRLDSCKKVEAKDVLGHTIYVSELPLNAIKCIYLGCNAPDTTKNLAIDFHNKTGVNVMFLRVHDEEYKLMPYTFLGAQFSGVRSLTEKLLFDRKKI